MVFARGSLLRVDQSYREVQNNAGAVVFGPRPGQ